MYNSVWTSQTQIGRHLEVQHTRFVMHVEFNVRYWVQGVKDRTQFRRDGHTTRKMNHMVVFVNIFRHYVHAQIIVQHKGFLAIYGVQDAAHAHDSFVMLEYLNINLAQRLKKLTMLGIDEAKSVVHNTETWRSEGIFTIDFVFLLYRIANALNSSCKEFKILSSFIRSKE